MLLEQKIVLDNGEGVQGFDAAMRALCAARLESRKVSDVEFKLVCDEPEEDASDDKHVSWGCLGESAIAIYQGVGGWKLDIRG